MPDLIKMLTCMEKFIAEFNKVQQLTSAIAKRNGFEEGSNELYYVPMKLALIGTEVSEAIEAHRIGKDSELDHELADIVIRTMDLAQILKIDLAKAIVKKHIVNSMRPYKHGGKRY